MMIDKKKVQNICVICWGLKGDLFLRVPLLEAIKIEMPWVSISAVVDENNVNVLKNHPAVDEVISHNRDKKNKIKYYVNTLKNIRELRKRKFDLTINFYSGGVSNLVVRAVNAKYRIGFNHIVALRLANNVLVDLPDMSKHWTFCLAHLLKPLGIEPSSVRRGSSFFITDEAKSFAAKHLEKFKNEKLVMYNLGAGRDECRWPIEHFVALSHKLYENYNIIPVVFTNPGMEELTDKFIKNNNNKIPVIHIPLMEFDYEAAIMDACYAVITGDTSLMHLAIALKKPILTIFLDTRPENILPEDCLFSVCDLRNDNLSGTTNKVLSCFNELNNLIDNSKFEVVEK